MNDSIVTPENTKLIAEWMGKEVSPHPDNKGVLIFPRNPKLGDFTNRVYNLITNAEQSREVEKKLLGLGWMLNTLEDSYVLLYQGVGLGAKGGEIIEESLSLAIYKAALYECSK